MNDNSFFLKLIMCYQAQGKAISFLMEGGLHVSNTSGFSHTCTHIYLRGKGEGVHFEVEACLFSSFLILSM